LATPPVNLSKVAALCAFAIEPPSEIVKVGETVDEGPYYEEIYKQMVEGFSSVFNDPSVPKVVIDGWLQFPGKGGGDTTYKTWIKDPIIYNHASFNQLIVWRDDSQESGFGVMPIFNNQGLILGVHREVDDKDSPTSKSVGDDLGWIDENDKVFGLTTNEIPAETEEYSLYMDKYGQPVLTKTGEPI
jgi:hypothetical protein